NSIRSVGGQCATLKRGKLYGNCIPGQGRKRSTNLPKYTPAPKISLQGKYERRGPLHCIDATVTVQLNTVTEKHRLGRFCIESTRSSNSGEENLPGGVVLHWELKVA